MRESICGSANANIINCISVVQYRAKYPMENFSNVSKSNTILKESIFSIPSKKPLARGFTMDANTTSVRGNIYTLDIFATSAIKSPKRKKSRDITTAIPVNCNVLFNLNFFKSYFLLVATFLVIAVCIAMAGICTKVIIPIAALYILKSILSKFLARKILKR